MNDTFRVRVMVLSAWDEVVLDVSPTTTLAAVKRSALEQARVSGQQGEFIVKFRGARLRDETMSLQDAGVPNDAGLIVMHERRMAVR